MDVIDLDLHFLGGSAYDDTPVWNGTGACTTHHGESDCYADIYNLCARQESGNNLTAYWPFTYCMFASQELLCPDTWNSTTLECGASPYSSTAFDPVVAACSAELDVDTANKITRCAVSSDHQSMGDEGFNILAEDFNSAAEADPAGTPVWINVAGALIDEHAFATPEEWADGVLLAICEAYSGASPPAACSNGPSTGM